MIKRRYRISDPRIQAAIEELKALIRSRYPDAVFSVSQRDDPVGTYLKAVVDIEDTDAVTDLVVERMLQMQIDQGLDVYVLPVRPLERVLAYQEQLRRERAAPAPALPREG